MLILKRKKTDWVKVKDISVFGVLIPCYEKKVKFKILKCIK